MYTVREIKLCFSSSSFFLTTIISENVVLFRHQTNTSVTLILMFFRYEIFLDEVKPSDLSVNFLQEFMALPLSYLAPGAAVQFRKCTSGLDAVIDCVQCPHIQRLSVWTGQRADIRQIWVF